jgi:hypothetical protein
MAVWDFSFAYPNSAARKDVTLLGSIMYYNKRPHHVDSAPKRWEAFRQWGAVSHIMKRYPVLVLFLALLRIMISILNLTREYYLLEMEVSIMYTSFMLTTLSTHPAVCNVFLTSFGVGVRVRFILAGQKLPHKGVSGTDVRVC